MKTLFLTNEYPPTIYGGAGVHVEYLSRELAKLMEVEVRCYGKEAREQRIDTPALVMLRPRKRPVTMVPMSMPPNAVWPRNCSECRKRMP